MPSLKSWWLGARLRQWWARYTSRYTTEDHQPTGQKQRRTLDAYHFPWHVFLPTGIVSPVARREKDNRNKDAE